MKKHDTSDRSPAAPPAPPAPTVRRTVVDREPKSGAVWPTLLATVFLFGGVGLSALPTLLPQLAWITAGLAKHGLTGAPLVLSGCVLLGARALLRGRTSPVVVELPREQPELGDRLAGEIADVRGVLGELRMEVIYLRDAQRALLQSFTDAPEPQNDGQQTAIFRLAASLDQIGARIEQRLTQSHATLSKSIEELDQRLSGPATPAKTYRPAYTDLDLLSEELGYANIAGPSGPAANGDGGDIRKNTGEDARRGTGQQRGLGLLDTIDDSTLHVSASTTHPVPAPIAGAAPHAIDPALYATDRQPGASRAQAEIVDPLLADKLGLLKSLLADGDVREALATMRAGR